MSKFVERKTALFEVKKVIQHLPMCNGRNHGEENVWGLSQKPPEDVY